jgi:hypothetical protein
MSKQPTRGKLTHDHELLVMSRGFDLLATLPPDRRRFVAEYWVSRIDDLPVIAQVEAPADDDDDEPPMMPHLRGAAAAVA